MQAQYKGLDLYQDGWGGCIMVHPTLMMLHITRFEKSDLLLHCAHKVPSIIHLSSFSFDRRASTKMPPGESFCLALAAEIWKDGFVTGGDELKLSIQCELPSLPAAWLVPEPED